MNMTLLRRGIVALAVLAASATLGRAELPQPGAPPAAGTLSGQLLVADPEMDDPYFRRTVILLVRQGPDGAFGIIVNRPVGDRPWADLLKELGEDVKDVAGSVAVYSGGPVEPWSGFVLHSADYRRNGTIGIDSQVAMTSTPEVLRDLAHHAGPHKSLLAFGYAGWAPGQLEQEMAQHGWFTIPDDPKLLFDDDRAKVWNDAVARRTITL